MRMMRLLPFLLVAGVAAAVQAAGSLDPPPPPRPAAVPPQLARRQLLPLPPPLRDATADPPSPAAPSDPAPAQPDTPSPAPPAAAQPDSPSPAQPAAPNSPPPPDPANKSPNAGSQQQQQQQQRANPADPAPGTVSRPRQNDAVAPDSQASSRPTKANPGKGNSTSTAKAPTPSTTPAATAEDDQGSGSNTGPILGGVLGGLAALVGLLALGYRWKSSAARQRKTAAVSTESKLSPEFKLKPQPAEASFVPVSPQPRGSLTPLMHGSAGSVPSPSPVPPNSAYASYGNGAIQSPPNSGVLAPLRVMNSTEQGHRPAEDDESGYLSGYPPSVPGPRPYPSPLPNGYQGGNSMGMHAPSSGDVYSYAFPDRPRPRETPTQQQTPEVYHNSMAQLPMSSPAYGNPRTGPFQQQQQPYQSAGPGSYASQGRMAPNYPGASPMSHGTPYNRDQQGGW